MAQGATSDRNVFVDMVDGAPESATSPNATAPQDVKTAIQFIKNTMGSGSTRFVDDNSLVAWGFSAGAHLAVLLGASGTEDEGLFPELRGRAGGSTRVRAVVGQSPAIDFPGFVTAAPLPAACQRPQDDSMCGTPGGYPSQYNPSSTAESGCPLPSAQDLSTTAINELISGAPNGVAPNVLDGTLANNSPTAQSIMPPVHANTTPMYLLASVCDGTIPHEGAIAYAAQYPSLVHLTLVNDPAHTGCIDGTQPDCMALSATSGTHRDTLNHQYNPTGTLDVCTWLTQTQGIAGQGSNLAACE
jgi:hypothetical protein